MPAANKKGDESVPVLRYPLLFLLLLSEVLILTFSFDSEPLEKSNSLLVRLIGNSAVIPRVVLSVLAALVLIAGAVILKHFRADVELRLTPRRMGLRLVLHLGCFLLLFWITQKLFTGGDSVLNSYAWPMAWLMAMPAVAISWAGMVAPGKVYRLIIAKHWKLILASGGLGIMGWSVGMYSKLLFGHLGYATFWCSGRILNVFTDDIVSNWDTRELGTSKFWVFLADQCSGYEGIGMILIFLGAYLWVSRDSLRFPRAFCLLPLGVAAVWLANCLRIALLILVGTNISENIAAGGFHSVAGSLLFCSVALGIAWAAHHSPWINKKFDTKRSDREATLTTAYLLPFLAILAVAMITGLAAASFDYGYPVRVIIASALLWHYRKYYESIRFELAWIPIAAGLATCIIWLALSAEPSSASNAAFAAGLKSMNPLIAALWLLCRLFGAGIVVPLAEEIAFRGYLTRRIISADFSKIPMGQFSWLSFTFSSVIFGVLHQRWIAGIIAGLVYALILYRRRNLADAVIAHATTNFALSACVLWTQKWSLWI